MLTSDIGIQVYSHGPIAEEFPSLTSKVDILKNPEAFGYIVLTISLDVAILRLDTELGPLLQEQDPTR